MKICFASLATVVSVAAPLVMASAAGAQIAGAFTNGPDGLTGGFAGPGIAGSCAGGTCSFAGSGAVYGPYPPVVVAPRPQFKACDSYCQQLNAGGPYYSDR